ncbi:MAG: phasin family protein [Hyphomicrobium sp.]
MYDKPQFEIPEAVRELAERNVEQARSAFGQFMDMARQAQQIMVRSQGAMAAGMLDVQSQALRYAEENIEASFKFATELSRARDLNQVLEVQQRHAQKQMQSYATQAQEIGRLMTDAAEKAKPKI